MISCDSEFELGAERTACRRIFHRNLEGLGFCSLFSSIDKDLWLVKFGYRDYNSMF